jgi:4-hydroxybenzoate polyprenyltransferase
MNRLRTYARLLRLPNLPSALADIVLGAFAVAVWKVPGGWLASLLLLPATACLYCAGMAWNDFFDREQDRRERPERPIPSGEVSPREAQQLGLGLMVAGVMFAALAGWAPALVGGKASAAPAVLAVLLVGAIFLYDGVLKTTPLGPVAMGLCRFLNVLLGVSANWGLAWPRGAHLALVVGLYIAGVTWFARREAGVSKKNELIAAACVLLAALLLAVGLPLRVPGPLGVADTREAADSSPLFPYLLAALGFFLAPPVLSAIWKPTPPRVQAAVKRALLGLIVLDAVLATALAGTVGLTLLLLLLPGLYLNRQKRLYAT